MEVSIGQNNYIVWMLNRPIEAEMGAGKNAEAGIHRASGPIMVSLVLWMFLFKMGYM